MKKFKNNTRQSNKVVVFLRLFLSLSVFFLSKQSKVFAEKYRRFFLVFKFKFGFDLDGHEGRMRVIPYTVVPKASFTNLPVNCVKRKHKEEKYFEKKNTCISKYNFQQSKWKTVERDDLCNYQ
jgi:hypothetical protein